jgi:GIY-YIG catalytic domain
VSDPGPLVDRNPDAVNFPPFETEDLRENLTRFLDTPFNWPGGPAMPVGNFRWGVYAFFDYDSEPIYVGQTNERLRTRIRRHLTNQRTDAVAMSVLDPFEVFEIAVWPLPHLQESSRSDADARQQLDALERLATVGSHLGLRIWNFAAGKPFNVGISTRRNSHVGRLFPVA